ncbi:MAG: ATP-binding protein [Thermoplasmatales archaeon]|nr:ATP-binding protein [Thermoplasmatales archaeon]
MKQIVVISGKGGTGKTTLVGAFAILAKNKIIADCDVDAPDLHLILNPEIKEKHEFKGSKEAIMDESKCIKCGECEKVCRFEAISDFKINQFKCEGCGACAIVCPADAITLKEKISGYWFVSSTDFGHFVHAQLNIGEGNSGKLVSVVRQKARTLAENNKNDYIIIDGPPGIGCPVIASMANADIALVVTEPTMSGLHDMKRIIDVAKHFGVKATVCINKYDVNPELSKQIESYCIQNQMDVTGEISFDPMVTKAMVNGKSIIEYPDEKVSKEIKRIWERIKRYLDE